MICKSIHCDLQEKLITTILHFLTALNRLFRVPDAILFVKPAIREQTGSPHEINRSAREAERGDLKRNPELGTSPN